MAPKELGEYVIRPERLLRPFGQCFWSLASSIAQVNTLHARTQALNIRFSTWAIRSKGSSSYGCASTKKLSTTTTAHDGCL